MNRTSALITIGITCYSEGDWLLECWQSVLAQTDDRWVAVLVMDGTTHKRTRELFEQLHHPKLRKCAMPNNVGPYPTRNMAFELTETPYHFYLDGDDQLIPDSVALVSTATMSVLAPEVRYCGFRWLCDRKTLWKTSRRPEAAPTRSTLGNSSAVLPPN
jgi:glycosyltransferase involved in cell wall biosynthesis